MKTPGGEKESYEKRDANVRAITYFGIGLLAITLIAALLMLVLFRVFDRYFDRSDIPRFYIRDERWSSPDILLEVHPSKEYETLRQENAEKLASYGWVDREKGIVRIPVNAAIKLAALKGLQSTPVSSAPPQQEAVIPEKKGGLRQVTVQP